MISEISLLRFGVSTLKDAANVYSKHVKAPRENSDEALSRHISSIEAWSGALNMFGITRTLDIDSASIELSISTQPRKFFGHRDPEYNFSERDLIAGHQSMLVLGDPGSGKTTLIKRLVQNIIHTPEEELAEDVFFPILVFGRDIKGDHTLIRDIFEAIGFSLIQLGTGARISELERHRREQVTEIERAVQISLQNAKVLLFIDGVDEIDPSTRDKFMTDVERLNNTMSSGRIIMTCRSGEWNSGISNFDVCELVPLSDEEIKRIVGKWADNSTAFMKRIANIPYRDVLDRPLFLTMLILVFNQTKDLPEQPIDVYYRVINLLIEKWDSQRGIHRPTKYEGFLSERKFKFLCALAFTLTNELEVRRFSSRKLQEAIGIIGPVFGISPWDCEGVAREIESHTGIVVESGYDNYEFCHLTVQEFLAANHLVAMPNIGDAVRVLWRAPAVVAVAIALSSDPSGYFAEVILRMCDEGSGRSGHDHKPITQLRPLLARLRLELPRFDVSSRLGVSILLLISLYGEIAEAFRTDDDPLNDLGFLISDVAVVQSMAEAECEYTVVGVEQGGKAVNVSLGKNAARRLGFKPPSLITFTYPALRYAMRRGICEQVVTAWQPFRSR